MGSLTAGRKVRPSELQMSVSRYYSNDTTSSIVSGGADLTLQYAVTDSSHANVTASGTGNNTFTLNQSGIWIIEASTHASFSSNPSSGDVSIYLIKVSGAVQLNWQTIPKPIPGAAVPNVCVIRTFTSGDQVQAKYSNGTNVTTTMSNIAYLSHISLTWLQGT